MDEASPKSFYPETPIVADVCCNLILAFPRRLHLSGGGEAFRSGISSRNCSRFPEVDSR